MRRADRLFQLVQIIRGRRLSTAALLAQRLEVSERTIYRDVADLQAQGVPIEGEAGVGYRLGAGFDLPPLMFTADEAQALVAAVRLAQPWLDPAMALSAEQALGRVLSVLPRGLRTAAQALAVYAPPPEATGLDAATAQTLQGVRQAVQGRQRLCIGYTDEQGRRSQRVLRPLGCFHWGKVWTLAAWCEHRQDFRSFRVDRITSLAPPAEGRPVFADEPGRTLADYLRSVVPEPVRRRWDLTSP
ncbi:helix-turn-helix transcriptional regulator [Hydrogenophaga soli]